MAYDKNNNKMKFGFLFLSFFAILNAQKIQSVKIIGNLYTKDHIIKREITHPIPGDFSETHLKEDRNRIYNLGIFSTVDISVQNSVYTISVVETFRFLPFPLFKYDEGIGISYGGGLAYKNFRGLNQKLVFGMLSGKDKTWFIDFMDPWITGDHISINFGLYNFHADGSVYAYNYHEEGEYLGVGFYRGNQHKYYIKIGTETIQLDTVDLKINNRWDLNDTNFAPKYSYLFTSLNYQYDTRDVFIDPSIGHHLSVHLKPRLGFNNTANHIQLKVKHTVYTQVSKSFGNPVLSIRSTIFFQKSNLLPLFSKVYIGGEDYVRGYSPLPWQNPRVIEHKIEGVHALYESIQLQHTWISRKDWGVIEFGVDGGYFIDIGIVVNNLKSAQINNAIIGYGIGVRFFISGVGVIGIDFGFNPYGSSFIHPTSQN